MTNRKTALATGILITLTSCSGCGLLARKPDWELGETTLTSESDELLSVASAGALKVSGQKLQLEVTRESERFGIRMVDASRLPRPWRPDHATDGGVLVTSIDTESPAAVAGLRPLDRLDSIDGVPVGDPDGALRLLRATRSGSPARFVVTRAGDRREVIEVTPREHLEEGITLSVPFLFEVENTATRSSFWFPEGVLLGGTVFARFSALTRASATAVPQELVGAEGDYYERSRWQSLFRLIQWETVRNVRTGKSKSTLTLFWFIEI